MRFKGLGEISPEEFAHFIGPDMRLEQVTLHKTDQVQKLLEYYMGKNLKSEAVDHLFEAIMTLKDLDEYYAFFEDVCTVNELLSLSQRFEVAKMLRDQKTYLDIAEKTGASTATISRVNRSLNYGNDGYDMVFSRMQNTDK